jgi:arylsulfatase A-like enzyme
VDTFGRSAIAAVALLAACAGPTPPAPPANVVVIAFDALRADHLGCYGHPRPTSPRIDALAREGIVFETAVSPAPWTLPAFASMFTGLLPSHHRAGEGKLPYVSGLDAAQPTLASVLHDRGFRTAAFVSNTWVGPTVGLDRGFEAHEVLADARGAADRATAWLAHPPAERFFLFVHLFEPHAPYTPPPDDARLFVAPEYDGPFRTAFPTVWKNGVPEMRVDPHWTPEDRRRIGDLYDAEIHHADGLVGRLLDTLAAAGRAGDTLVVVVSDHGEELFDHGALDHGHTLFDELLRVPLVVRLPGAAAGQRIAAQVSTVSLLSTVLDAVGVDAPPARDAPSLMPLVRGAPAGPPAPVLAEFVVLGRDPGAKAIRLPGEKLVVFPADGARLYYDLAADPREQRNLAAERRVRADALAAELEQRLLAPLDGFHLFAVGTTEHGVRLVLESPDGFADATPLDLEDGDSVTVDATGRILVADLQLRPREAPIGRYDLDGARFRTRGDAPLVFREALLDGGPLPAKAFALGGTPRSPLPAPGEAMRLDLMRLPYPQVPTRLEGDVEVRLQLVRPAAPPPATLTPDVVEKLRGLGYVQ